MGENTFSLQEYYRFVFSDNIPSSLSQKHLQTVIGTLQRLAGMNTPGSFEDVDNDGKIGLQETLWALQSAAELR